MEKIGAFVHSVPKPPKFASKLLHYYRKSASYTR